MTDGPSLEEGLGDCCAKSGVAVLFNHWAVPVAPCRYGQLQAKDGDSSCRYRRKQLSPGSVPVPVVHGFLYILLPSPEQTESNPGPETL